MSQEKSTICWLPQSKPSNTQERGMSPGPTEKVQPYNLIMGSEQQQKFYQNSTNKPVQR